jgi:hypothetical protein
MQIVPIQNEENTYGIQHRYKMRTWWCGAHAVLLAWKLFSKQWIQISMWPIHWIPEELQNMQQKFCTVRHAWRQMWVNCSSCYKVWQVCVTIFIEISAKVTFKNIQCHKQGKLLILLLLWSCSKQLQHYGKQHVSIWIEHCTFLILPGVSMISHTCRSSSGFAPWTVLHFKEFLKISLTCWGWQKLLGRFYHVGRTHFSALAIFIAITETMGFPPSILISTSEHYAWPVQYTCL